MMKKNLFLSCFLLNYLLLTGITRTMAQQSGFQERFSFDLQFGSRSYHRDSLPSGKDIDFLNYLATGSGWNASQYIDLGLSLKTSEKWAFTATLKLLSDFRPGHLGISAQYIHPTNPRKFSLGAHADFNFNRLTINQFNQYHAIKDSGFIADLNPNYRQRDLTDIRVGISPYIELNPGRFHLKLTSGIGINLFIPFSETIVQKKEGSNLKREIRYETHNGPALYLAPDLTVRFDIVRSGKRSFGLLMKGALLYSKRTLPYTRSTDIWTYENTTEEDISPEKTWFRRRDLSFGVYAGL